MSKRFNYIDAILTNSTPRIMGVKLRPFSIGHYLLMKKYDCNYVSDEPADTSIDDLVLSISICCRKFDEFVDFISDKNCLKWIAKWGKQINKEVNGDPFYIIKKRNEFIQYLNEGMRIPKYWLLVEEDDGGSSGRLMEHIITTLQGELGYTKDEVLNIPFTQAIYDYFLYLENKGIIKLMTDEELNLVEANNGA
jgi:hypothetical protein